ncbi:MAG: hypothetical protein K0Q72_4093 [Armatimonadetes bacterium]|nr:hypothetical protein [Armatimonadota bacterium]
MATIDEGPAERAERLLLDVLGEAQFHRLRKTGYLDLPSPGHRGRVYRLDTMGNLSFRDPGENGFNTTLCVQPLEQVPRDDMVAARYLLVTADEERLLSTANPITFGFLSLARALYQDFRQKHSPFSAGLLTAGIIVFFLGSLALEVWTAVALLPSSPILAVVAIAILLIPALVGLVLLAAAGVEMVRGVTTWRARSRLGADFA